MAVAVGLGLAAALWSLVASAGWFPRALFPSVPEIAAAGAKLWEFGDLGPDILLSLQRAALGFVIGSLAGFGPAVLTSATALGRRLLQPVLRVFAPSPPSALCRWPSCGSGWGRAAR